MRPPTRDEDLASLNAKPSARPASCLLRRFIEGQMTGPEQTLPLLDALAYCASQCNCSSCKP